MPCCGAELGGVQFRRAVQAGEWRATQTAPVLRTRGYHLDAFTSPFESLPTIVRTWKRASKHLKQTSSLADVIAFQCGRLALPYRAEPAQGVTPELIARACRAGYTSVPVGASVLVGACDTQDNRLEAEVSAWGLVEVDRDEAEATGLRGWESHEYKGLRHGGRWYRLRRWAIEYRRFPGDPGSPEVWEELAEFMEQHREHESGVKLAPDHHRGRHRRALRRAGGRLRSHAGIRLPVPEGSTADTIRWRARAEVDHLGLAARLWALRLDAHLHERRQGVRVLAAPPVVRRHRAAADDLAGR